MLVLRYLCKQYKKICPSNDFIFFAYSSTCQPFPITSPHWPSLQLPSTSDHCPRASRSSLLTPASSLLDSQSQNSLQSYRWGKVSCSRLILCSIFEPLKNVSWLIESWPLGLGHNLIAVTEFTCICRLLVRLSTPLIFHHCPMNWQLLLC